MVLSASPAIAAYAEPSGNPYAYTNEEELRRQEQRYDGDLLTKEIKDFVALLEKKGSKITAQELQEPRLKVPGVRVRRAKC